MENRVMRLEGSALSGILTVGGTILGTSRDKRTRCRWATNLDMTDAIVDTTTATTWTRWSVWAAAGRRRTPYRLMQKGSTSSLPPKTIDNDVAMTDTTFGFDTALGIATEAVDRLHSTAHSHHRIIVVEVMGHNAGWLALGAGMAGGADVILIPRSRTMWRASPGHSPTQPGGKRFSIVVVSEGALERGRRQSARSGSGHG